MGKVNPNETVEYNGIPVAIRDLPPDLRALAGVGHDPVDVRTREHHGGAWSYTPDMCLVATDTQGVWINDGWNLVCRGCGLDYT